MELILLHRHVLGGQGLHWNTLGGQGLEDGKNLWGICEWLLRRVHVQGLWGTGKLMKHLGGLLRWRAGHGGKVLLCYLTQLQLLPLQISGLVIDV